MNDKPAHHRVDVIRIEQVLPHGNADKLEIIPIEGFQAVVGKGQFKVGDLAYYVPPDSVVPDRPEFAFLWGNATFEGGTPARKRRITAKKLRGEWSEGVLMPLPDGDQVTKSYATVLDVRKNKYDEVTVGDDVSEILGIEHYNPPEPGEAYTLATGGNGRKGLPRSFRGWISFIKGWLSGERRESRGPEGVPTYDVDNLKKYMNAFVPGERVRVTEKIHGSNARYTFRKGGFFGKDKMFAGSRNLWKAEASTCAWRRALKDNTWIEPWCRMYPGYTLYGEIVPTQKGFDYGTKDVVRFFLFDVRTPDGKWVEVDDPMFTSYDSNDYNVLLDHSVPLVCDGGFDFDTIKNLVEGRSNVAGAKHIREGVVIKAVPERTDRSIGRVQLKLVSNTFLEKDSK